MIKEFFEIEPSQKNTLLSLLGISFLCFLQLYLFKIEIFENNTFEIIGISLALTVCWSVLNIIPLALFVVCQTKEENMDNVKYGKIIFTLGVIALCWITLLTYIAYEFKLCFKELIRLGITVSLLRSVFWFIFSTLQNQKKSKNKKK